MNLTKINTVNDYVAAFAAAFQRGTDAWIEAGKILNAAIEAHPGIEAEILEQCRSATRADLNRLKAIGRGTLHPLLADGGSCGRQALGRLPIADQEKYLENPIPVIVREQGKTDVLLIAIDDLTREQCRQVFARDHVRTTAEQSAWLASQATFAKPITDSAPPLYTIRRGHCVIGGVTFDKKTLLQICAQMEG